MRKNYGKYYHGKLELEEVHRFPNYPVEEEGGLYWDIDYLFQQVIKGIEVATSNYPIDSLGIDTWGVDFGLLDKEGQLLKNQGTIAIHEQKTYWPR